MISVVWFTLKASDLYEQLPVPAAWSWTESTSTKTISSPRTNWRFGSRASRGTTRSTRWRLSGEITTRTGTAWSAGRSIITPSTAVRPSNDRVSNCESHSRDASDPFVVAPDRRHSPGVGLRLQQGDGPGGAALQSRQQGRGPEGRQTGVPRFPSSWTLPAHERGHGSGEWGHVRSREVTWGHMRSPEVTWGHLRSPEVTWGHVRSREVTDSGSFSILSACFDLCEQETMEDIDKNGDGFIDLKEFMGIKFCSQLSPRNQMFLIYIWNVKFYRWIRNNVRLHNLIIQQLSGLVNVNKVWVESVVGGGGGVEVLACESNLITL